MKEELITGIRKGISNFIVHYKTVVDTKNNLYKIETLVLGLFRSGYFRALPKLDYVLVFQNCFLPACEACAIDKDENTYYQVSLVHHKNRRIIVHETKEIADAFELAESLQYKLNLPLRDASVRGKAIWRLLK